MDVNQNVKPNTFNNPECCNENGMCECPVCLTERELKELPCHHYVCEDCIQSIIQNIHGNPKCPTCRKEFNSYGCNGENIMVNSSEEFLDVTEDNIIEILTRYLNLDNVLERYDYYREPFVLNNRSRNAVIQRSRMYFEREHINELLSEYEMPDIFFNTRDLCRQLVDNVYIPVSNGDNNLARDNIEIITKHYLIEQYALIEDNTDMEHDQIIDILAYRFLNIRDWAEIIFSLPPLTGGKKHKQNNKSKKYNKLRRQHKKSRKSRKSKKRKY